MYARKDANGWHLSVADGEAYPMWETSLTLDTTGRPHISYFNFVLEDLRYAHFVGPMPIVLFWNIVGSDMQILWDVVPEALAYWVYGASDYAHFVPGLAPGFEYRINVLPPGTTTWISPYPIGDPEDNWTYLVMAVDEVEAELARSNRVGEFDFGVEVP
jgi:hypothetical protein